MRRWSLLGALAGVLVLSAWLGCSNPNLAGGKLHWEQARRIEDPVEREARFRRALETFEKARAEMPANGEVRQWLGMTFAELDMPDSAAANFDRAVELSPELAEDVWANRGHYYSESYNEALSVASEAQDARQQQNAELAQEKFREALAIFEVARKYDPDAHMPEAHKVYTMIGKVHLNLGEVEPALQAMRKAQDLAPDDLEVKRDLFASYSDQAERAYRSGAEKMQAGDSTAARDLYLAAREMYDRAEDIEPENTDILFMQGATAYELSQLDPAREQELLDEAIQSYRSVLEENPADVEVLYNLAIVLRDLDRNEEAREIADRLVNIRPKDGSYRDILGRIDDKLGNKDALVSGIVFGRALKNGVKVPVERAQANAEASPPGSGIRSRLLESGPPEEILTFTDSNNQPYEVWFYWMRGRGYGFRGGVEEFRTEFTPADVLEVNNLAVEEEGTSKVLTGMVSNASTHAYDYVRVEFELTDAEGNAMYRSAVASADHLDPNGDWRFEVPLNGELEKAAGATVADILAY